MLFSSIVFIYYFLPLLLIVYFIVPKKYKNLVLLLFSLIFYFIGEPKYIIILLSSCIINYYLGIQIEKKNKPKIFLILAILYNVIQLLIFKYTDFFIQNINNIFHSKIPLLYIVMPIGISFFTFQTLGYVIDIYQKKHSSAKNLLDFMMYVCLFPQLVAGPIVRYSDIATQVTNRDINYETFSEGIKRFVIGLSKKVLLANVLGEFTQSILVETVLSSWVKPIFYTLQIYFDFSGYSDMAIGLGLMFGFHFKENFNYPLIATSITSFWRKWHISLSSWFRDYIYIPLGGNRVSKVKWFRNIFIVWFLTGFWHGASWNFIIWGLYFCIILLLEKIFLKKYLDKMKFVNHIYSLIIIVISFLIFSVNSTTELLDNLKNMFFLNKLPVINHEIIYQLKNYLVLFIVAIIASTPIMSIIIKKLRNTSKLNKVINILEPIYYLLLLIMSTAFLIDASFNPFLYFRF